MRIAGLAAFMGMSVLSLLAQSAPASAQADCKAVVAPSPFGPDDQTGATNRVTPAVTKAAAAEIQTGVVTPMANNLVDGVPLFGTRFTKTILTSFAVVPGAEYGKNKLSYMEDTYLSQSHVGTHIDGMGHIGIQDCYYNQTPMGKYVTQNYLKRLGLENIKTFATRGVIIDAVKVFQAAGKLKANAACKNPCLDARHGDHRGRSAGRAEDVQRHPARGRRGVHQHRLGRPVPAVPGAERDLQRRRARHQQVGGDVARIAEGGRRRHRHLGGRGDPGRGHDRGVPGAQDRC